jgi:hypothetical protein
MSRDVYDLADGNNVVVSVYVAIKEPLIPETIPRLTIFIDIIYFTAVEDTTLAPQRSQRADIGVHGSEDNASVGDLALDVPGSVVPVNTDRLDWEVLLIVDVDKFHNASKIVGLARWFAHEIDMI